MSRDAAAFKTRRLFVWLDQVRADCELHPRCFVVAYTIGQHVNQSSWLAFPSQKTIVAQTRLNERTVRDALRDLEDRGHVQIGSLQGRGKGNRNTYKPLLKSADEPASFCRFTELGTEETSRLEAGGKPAESRGFTDDRLVARSNR